MLSNDPSTTVKDLARDLKFKLLDALRHKEINEIIELVNSKGPEFMVAIQDLAKNLRSQLQSKPNKGALYKSIALVAGEDTEEVANFYRIKKSKKLGKDINILNKLDISKEVIDSINIGWIDTCKDLGIDTVQYIPKQIPIIKDLLPKSAKETTLETKYILLIIVAAALLGVWLTQRDSRPKEKKEAPGPVHTPKPAPSPPSANPFALALVLPGSKLGDIKAGKLELDDLIKLLNETRYFFCQDLQQMQDTQKKLALSPAEVDRTSDELVFVQIGFESTSQAVTKATFRGALERYLREGGNTTFRIEVIKTLERVSGLQALGFIQI